MLVDEVPNREGAPPKIDAAVAAAVVEVVGAERRPKRLGAAEEVGVAPKSEPDAAAVGAGWPAIVAPKMEPGFARAVAGAAVGAPASRGDAPASLVPAGAPKRLVVTAPSAPAPGEAVVNVPISAEKPGSVFATLTAAAGAALVIAAVPGATCALGFDKSAWPTADTTAVPALEGAADCVTAV